jgi:RNA polymerase sigma-70 factor, ECF subfamily
MEYTFWGPKLMHPTDSINGLRFPAAADTAPWVKASEIEREVMELFEQFRDPRLRCVLSFGIPVHDAEEVIQEVFLSLFRHLQLRRHRKNLRSWTFRVAHNLLLKQLYANQKLHAKTASDWTIAKEQLDPSPDPEGQLSSAQRRRRLLAVVQALPEADQGCLSLRAEGLHYQEIVAVLEISGSHIDIADTITGTVDSCGREMKLC